MTIAGWDFNGYASGGASPQLPNSTSSNVTIGGLTRGSAFGITGSPAGNAWGTTVNVTSLTSSASAVSSNSFISFTVKANTGYTLSISSFSPYNVRRSSTGPTSGQWQYSINGGSYFDIGGVPITWGSTTSSTGNLQQSINLSGVTNLQNIPSTSTVTFRCSIWGASGTSGTWYLNQYQLGDDFAVLGLVSALPSGNTVTFNSNGGSGTMASQTSSVASNLNANTFTRSGFTFTGWNTAADGSGTSYENQASYPFASSVTLYAQWCPNNTWLGGSSGNWNTASNWCGGVPASGSNLTIPAGTTVTLDGTNEVTVGDLTINATGSLILPSNAKLTVTGNLVNNGTMTLENGATFLQDPLSTITSGTTGTFNVKQTVTGAGGAGSAPTGRFWYMGVPLNNLTRGAAFGNDGTDNRLWSWTESGQPQWSSQITDNNAPLVPTTGYVFRTSAPSTTLNFSGTSLYSIDASIPNLSNSSGSFAGCHLRSNPYTAYLDWEQVFTASTNISSTYCIPTFNGSSMVYDTYNATGNVAVFPSGVAMTNFIAPMQAFWVVVNPSTQGTLNMTKAMLSHQAGAVGLKDITSFPAFARLNLVSGDFYDQVVVYTDANATSEVEDYDSKKFFLPNKAQVYCPVGNDKLVINALKQGKAQTSAPLTVELPSTQVYKFEMAESFVENGLVVLEDKQEKIFQDMGVNPVYEFYGNSGVIADRFVLHFQLPNGTTNEGQAGVEDLTSGQIAVIANHDGAVTVALSADLTTSGDVQIFDGAGRLIAQKAITSAQTSLQLNNGTGVYFVRVQTPMKTEMKKVMVY